LELIIVPAGIIRIIEPGKQSIKCIARFFYPGFPIFIMSFTSDF